TETAHTVSKVAWTQDHRALRRGPDGAAGVSTGRHGGGTKTSVWSSLESVYRSCQYPPLHQATISGFTNVSLASDDTAQHNVVPSSSRSAQHAIIERVPMAMLGTVDVWLDRVKNEYKFQQYCWDLYTTTQHACASASRYESVGLRILGVESDWG